MKNFKTRDLSQNVIEHLLSLGIQMEYDSNIQGLLDAPYLGVVNNIITPIVFNTTFRNLDCPIYTEKQILKLKPLCASELTKTEKLIWTLMDRLNSNNNSNLSGYDVIFTIQTSKYDVYKSQLLPITPTACGGISFETMKFIIKYCDENKLKPYFTYCDYNNEKKLYGTNTSCIEFSI